MASLLFAPPTVAPLLQYPIHNLVKNPYPPFRGKKVSKCPLLEAESLSHGGVSVNGNLSLGLLHLILYGGHAVSAKLQEHAHRRKVLSEQVLPLEQKQSTTGKGILSMASSACSRPKCNFHHHARDTPTIGCKNRPHRDMPT